MIFDAEKAIAQAGEQFKGPGPGRLRWSGRGHRGSGSAWMFYLNSKPSCDTIPEPVLESCSVADPVRKAAAFLPRGNIAVITPEPQEPN